MFPIRLLSLCMFILVASRGNAHQPDSLKCWSAADRLQWSDFRGAVPKSMVKTNRVAACPSRITVESVRNNTSIQFSISVIFIKNQAWTKDTVSLYTLGHEQLHFDITELHARKIRKSISQLKTKKIMDFNRYQSEIQTLMTENDKMQVEYDNQSNHGIIEKLQKEWQKKITSELNALKIFATTEKDCG